MSAALGHLLRLSRASRGAKWARELKIARLYYYYYHVLPYGHEHTHATSTRSGEAAEMSQSITHMFGGVGDLRFDRKHQINIVIADI